MPTLNDNQANKQNGPAEQSSEEWLYVSLPGHPFYGQRVRLIKYQPASTARYCLIEDPQQSDFHYQIKSTWLSSSPPIPASQLEFKQPAVRIALSALDKMVQMILVHQNERRIKDVEPFIQRGSSPDLGTDPRSQPPEVHREALLPGAETGRRHST
jgi:hypothetical protein